MAVQVGTTPHEITCASLNSTTRRTPIRFNLVFPQFEDQRARPSNPRRWEERRAHSLPIRESPTCRKRVCICMLFPLFWAHPPGKDTVQQTGIRGRGKASTCSRTGFAALRSTVQAEDTKNCLVLPRCTL